MKGVKGPLFKWFGAKWRLSAHYPAPKHDVIVEPFAGSACYALRYAVGRSVLLFETNKQLVDLWNWLIQAKQSDILEIPLNLPEGTDIRTIGLSYGQALLLKHWQRTNNVGECWTISKWGHLPGQFTANTRARVADEIQFVRNWKIVGTSAWDSSNDDWVSDATYFIDPPYQHLYDYRVGKPDYRKLAQWCQSLKGQAIVCEAVCPKTGVQPNWLPFSPFRKQKTSRAGHDAASHNHSNELIWVNG